MNDETKLVSVLLGLLISISAITMFAASPNVMKYGKEPTNRSGMSR